MDLQLGVLVSAELEKCTVSPVAGGHRYGAGYARLFHRHSRRLAPGHLLAVDRAADPPEVVWRWYPATVTRVHARLVELDEPFHGRITATLGPLVSGPVAIGQTAFVSVGLADDWRVDDLGLALLPRHPAGLADLVFPEIAAVYRSLGEY